MHKLSLVIPTYNEAGNIENICRNLYAVLSKTNIDFELIVVDDNSSDGTWQIVQRLNSEHDNIKLVRRPDEKGLATAVLAGWKISDADMLGVIDGDGQHPPEVIEAMLGKMSSSNDTDIVIASRNIKGGGVSHWSIWRRGISWFGTVTSFALLPSIFFKTHDPMSGYFILRKRVIEKANFKPLGYKILVEILARAKYKKVDEVAYVFKERKAGGSKAGLKQYFTSLRHFLLLSIETREIYKLASFIFAILLAIIILSLFSGAPRI